MDTGVRYVGAGLDTAQLAKQAHPTTQKQRELAPRARTHAYSWSRESWFTPTLCSLVGGKH
jgi:hypothetical protein